MVYRVGTCNAQFVTVDRVTARSPSKIEAIAESEAISTFLNWWGISPGHLESGAGSQQGRVVEAGWTATPMVPGRGTASHGAVLGVELKQS